MTDKDLISAYLAKRAPTACAAAPAYGTVEHDRAKRDAKADEQRFWNHQRNWGAQARYDAAHGTVNGRDAALDERMAVYRREQ